MRHRLAWAFALVLALEALVFAAAPAGAQELRGTVRDSTSGHGIPGAAVLLQSADGRTVGRNITNERGEYRVALAAGATRVRVLRLGFRPRELAIPAAVDGVAHLDVTMLAIPTTLDAVQVSANASCPRRSDEAAAFALLEQARGVVGNSAFKTHGRL